VLSRIQRYVFKEVFVGAFLSLLVLVFILTAGNAMRDQLLQFMEGQFSFRFVMELFGLLLPYALKFALPPAVLTGILLGLGRLSADAEITAMRATGFSLWHVAVPILLMSVVLAGGSYYISAFAAPEARTQYKQKLSQTALENPLFFFKPQSFVTDFPGHLLYVGDYDGENLKDFWVWSSVGSGSELDEKGRIRQILRFDTGKIRYEEDSQTLVLEPQNLRVEMNDREDPEFFQGSYNPGLAASTVLRFSLGDRGDILSTRRKISMLTAAELMEEERELSQKAERDDAEEKHLRKVRLEIQNQASMACSVVALALMGIPLAIRKGRRETMINAVWAVGLALGYYLLTICVGMLEDYPELKPEWMIWAPNLLFCGLGFLQLRAIQ